MGAFCLVGGRNDPLGASMLKDDAATSLLRGPIGEALRQTASCYPDRTAVIWAEGQGLERMSYAVLFRRAEQVARWLAARLRPGERVVIWSRNSLEWLLLEYGCALSGLVVTAWNPAWTDAECLHARDLAEPSLVFAQCDVRGVDLLDRAKALVPRGTAYALADLPALTTDAPLSAPPTVAPQDLFLLQFTSGTTGRPKAAALTHHAALNAAWLRVRLYDGDETDVWLNPVPMTHVGGAVSIPLGAMATGAAYVLMNRFTAEAYNHLTWAAGATRLGGVPTMLIAAMEHSTWRPASSIRTIGMGGAQVSPALIAKVEAAYRAPVVVAYGQSECPLIASSLPGDAPHVAAETVGRAAPHTEIRICGLADGQVLPPGEVGEIVVRSPAAMTGYYRAPEATAEAIRPAGFLRTGDLGLIDADGRLHIQGRARDVIIRGGENIYPAEVEDVLADHPAVAAAAVIGVPDARYGQSVAAAVVLREGASATAVELEAHVAARLAQFKTPRAWRFETSLPFTASGKVRKVEVERLFS